MSIRKLVNIVKMTDNSKSVLYKDQQIMITDIWQPHEIAKIKVAVLILKARSVSGLPLQDSRHLESFAHDLLEKPIMQFEQKIADSNAEFQIIYNTEDGDILLCGNTIHPFVVSKGRV